MCLCKGQQTLSEEVRERTHSHMLKLEMENQSLLRTVEELRATSLRSSTRPSLGHRPECDPLVCSPDIHTSSTDAPVGFQPSCSHGKNHTDVLRHHAVTPQMLSGDPRCCQQHHTEELEPDKSEVLIAENPDLQEKGQLEEGQRGYHFKELMSELEVLENNHNRLHCFLESNGSSPCHDLAGLPARPSYTSKQTQRLEAKCRTLDTVSQHLQAALDNTGRICRSIKHQKSTDVVAHLFIFDSFLRLRRPESPAPGVGGAGTGGREPESAGIFRGTPYLCTTPGATGVREAKPGAGNHRPGEGKEAAGEREPTTPPAGREAWFQRCQRLNKGASKIRFARLTGPSSELAVGPLSVSG